MNQCVKCFVKIPWRTFVGEREVSLTKRKFCLSCSPLYARNTRSLETMNRDSSGERFCPRCKIKKPFSKFYERRNGRPGRHSSYCRACTHAECLDRQIKFKRRAMEYKGGKCVRCGFEGPDVCFDFHHRDRAKKRWGISVMKRKCWETAKEELDKCDLVCSNCHRIIEYVPVAQMERAQVYET